MTDQLDRLLKIDDQSHLPGAPRGIQAAFANMPETWREQGLMLARELADTGRMFTVEDLKRQGLPEPEHPNHWGSLLAGIQRRKIAACAGWTAHFDRTGTERPIRIWQRPQEGTRP